MPNLNEYRQGSILEFLDGTVGIVVGAMSFSGTYKEGDKIIVLIRRSDGTFYGDIAEGYFLAFKRDEFKFLGFADDYIMR